MPVSDGDDQQPTRSGDVPVTWLSLVNVCRLSGDELLPKPMMEYCQLDLWEQTV